MTSTKDPVVICAATRTPIGAFQGVFSSTTAPELGATAVKGVIEKAKLNDVSLIDECYMGCALPAGLGQAPARQAALNGGLRVDVPCTTVNKMCGSGMKAIMLGFDSIQSHTNDVVLVGGIENMTLAPYILPKARNGYRMGHGQIMDHMFLDGLEDAYDKGQLMGCFADQTALDEGFSREDQDNFAIESLTRAQKALANGWFTKEISPVEVKTKKETFMITEDETPQKAQLDKIPTLRPAFGKDGTVTAANASSISDGASALIIARKSVAEKVGLPILAFIHAHSSHAQSPSKFCTAPVEAMRKLFDKTNKKPNEIDLYEINEAFAVVTMSAMKAFKIPHEKVNVHGGACALGHPVGTTGARIVTTLLYALQQYDLKWGVASLCIGGGEATALMIERV